MHSCNAGEFGTPVRGTLGNGSSSQQPFETPENLIVAACGDACVVTPVMESALDRISRCRLHR
jgi:hypothetical protein